MWRAKATTWSRTRSASQSLIRGKRAEAVARRSGGHRQDTKVYSRDTNESYEDRTLCRLNCQFKTRWLVTGGTTASAWPSPRVLAQAGPNLVIDIFADKLEAAKRNTRRMASTPTPCFDVTKEEDVDRGIQPDRKRTRTDRHPVNNAASSSASPSST